MPDAPTLLTPAEVDRLLLYPRGRSARLAREGRFPHVRLPDGEIRFHADLIDQLIRTGLRSVPPPTEVVDVN